MKRKNAGRQYVVGIGIASALYVFILMFTQVWVDTLSPDNPARYPIAVLPVVPILLGFRAYLRFVRRMDEMEQRIQFEAVAFAVGVVGVVTFALGLLETAGMPPVSMLWIFPSIILLWGFGQILARRRYE
ncbi:MAG: hypothetical protein SF029_13780 [bacterium]|nr:hypothetical protein [bacterium]